MDAGLQMNSQLRQNDLPNGARIDDKGKLSSYPPLTVNPCARAKVIRSIFLLIIPWFKVVNLVI
ncbi:unnamed protein product [Ilex paraguariensis]|uniref:Uncharacterized protein n=1 Tax=Ilex paraguariensis TaxID=185542 RepID=A0ABC8RBA7_9AQUA